MNAYILTGGLSRRFGSDKAVYMINGTTFLDKIFKTLKSDFNNISSVGKKPFSKEINFLSDFTNCQAPIVGIITALRHTSSLWNFIISVDTPYITLDIINKLLKETINTTNNIIIPSVNGKLLPLSSLYHKNCLIYFERAYSLKKYTINDVIPLLRPKVVDLSNYKIQLKNVNTMEQLI